MSKKSFFWPILSDEERAKAARPKGQGYEQESMAPSQAPQHYAEQDFSGVEQMGAIPAMPTSTAPDELALGSQDVGSVPGAASYATFGQGGGVRDSSSEEHLLVLDNIQQSYEQADEDLVVLSGANLRVRAGEMVALVAPSGAGKSTLLHIAGLLERPSAGEVYIANVAQSQAADRTRTLVRRNEIGFVYQFHHLLAEFSALENVMLPQLIRGEVRKEAEIRAKELLAYMKIDHRSDHRPSELSGGEKQRVAIARAMANAPRVLLADEPTGNLDPNTSEYVFKALNALVKQSGIAALVATHNLFLAERMDRQITLVDGKIVDL